jgi:hypothetical protein
MPAILEMQASLVAMTNGKECTTILDHREKALDL